MWEMEEELVSGSKGDGFTIAPAGHQCVSRGSFQSASSKRKKTGRSGRQASRR
jgi:hypothetical protein